MPPVAGSDRAGEISTRAAVVSVPIPAFRVHTMPQPPCDLAWFLGQVLAAQPEVVVCYQLANLLQFYGATVTDLFEDSTTAALVTLVRELHELSLKVFFDQLNIRANALLVDVEQPPSSLGPPSDLERILELLRKVLSCQDVYAERTAAHDEDLRRILEYVLNPTLEMCTISASSLGPVRAAVYIINCV
jgi:hypothetical protein